MRSLTLAVLAAFSLTPPALAAPPVQQDPELVPPPILIPERLEKERKDERPTIIRWMVHPLKKRGMFINLPIIDTDPNRGTTVGVLPIWVIPEPAGDRIQQIHAPSLTYNKDFSFIPTYRYYYYPDNESTFVGRASISVKSEKEVLLAYDTKHLVATPIFFSIHTQYNIDGSNRFYGLGPDSSKLNETDYTEDYIGYDLILGVPIGDTPWMLKGSNHFVGQKFYGGKIDRLTDINTRFPGIAPARRQQDNETRAIAEYDSRDSGLTTSRGSYLQAFTGWSVDNFSSGFDYTRYGFDGRTFYHWPGTSQTTAAQVKYDQVLGDPPFWLQSRLGGKYSLRAYGDGRYIDRGALVANLEQRWKFMEIALAGVTTEFELAPFFGLGTVFDNPKQMQRRFVRPVVGSAIRAIARPQVVGSIDVGVGQEGVAVFMDINYSF